MDHTGAPSNLWLEVLKYVCFLLNHTYNASIDGIPLKNLTGQQVDISNLLRFHWYQLVYYKMPSSSKTYPSKSLERHGWIVGIAEHVGRNLTYWVVTKVAEYISCHNSQHILWQFEEIVSHQIQLSTDHKDYNGSTYNVKIWWFTGKITTEPLSVIAMDNPVVYALYVKDHSLLDTPGWKHFKKIKNRHKRLVH